MRHARTSGDVKSPLLRGQFVSCFFPGNMIAYAQGLVIWVEPWPAWFPLSFPSPVPGGVIPERPSKVKRSAPMHRGGLS